MPPKLGQDIHRLSLLRNIILFGSGCFFVFGVIYLVVLGSRFLFISNLSFGLFSGLCYFLLRDRRMEAVTGHVFLAVVWLGLFNLMALIGPSADPMVYWGFSITVAASFIFAWRGILAWAVLSACFLPLAMLFKTVVYPARVIALDETQGRLMVTATYLGLLSFLAYVFILFRRRLDRVLFELEGRNHHLQTLFRVVSHDFSGSLQRVRASAELQRDRLDAWVASAHAPLAAELIDLRDQARRQVEGVTELTTLLDSVRQFALASAPVGAGATPSADLYASLCECLRILETPCAAKRLRVKVENHAGEALPVSFEPVALVRQVLVNLVGNGVKFSPEGGQLTLRIEAQGESLVLCVQDEGPGFPGGERIGELEVHVGKSTPGSCGERGTGFGLAIAKAFIDRHGASLGVDSAPGRGTTLRVAFRRA